MYFFIYQHIAYLHFCNLAFQKNIDVFSINKQKKKLPLYYVLRIPTVLVSQKFPTFSE